MRNHVFLVTLLAALLTPTTALADLGPPWFWDDGKGEWYPNRGYRNPGPKPEHIPSGWVPPQTPEDTDTGSADPSPPPSPAEFLTFFLMLGAGSFLLLSRKNRNPPATGWISVNVNP